MYTQGVVYVAIGERFRSEARRSRESIRRWHPNWSVALITDEVLEQDHGLFDHVIHYELPPNGFSSKIQPMMLAPYDRNLFLDTDTIVCAPLDDLYNILDQFDFAASTEYCGVTGPFWRLSERERGRIPQCYPEFNTGVIAFRRTKSMQELLASWQSLYQEYRAKYNVCADQPSFRTAAYESGVRFAVLPFEYNFRPLWTCAVHGQVKILHIHDELIRGTASAMAERINRCDGVRLFIPGIGAVAGRQNPLIRAANFLRQWVVRYSRRQ